MHTGEKLGFFLDGHDQAIPIDEPVCPNAEYNWHDYLKNLTVNQLSREIEPLIVFVINTDTLIPTLAIKKDLTFGKQTYLCLTGSVTGCLADNNQEDGLQDFNWVKLANPARGFDPQTAETSQLLLRPLLFGFFKRFNTQRKMQTAGVKIDLSVWKENIRLYETVNPEVKSF